MRETIAFIAQRLGFPGVTLPMIKQQQDDPAMTANGNSLRQESPEGV
ncbi:MAG: hypothetical protein ACRDOK_30250 [Streptosporangiaceae bacterium]